MNHLINYYLRSRGQYDTIKDRARAEAIMYSEEQQYGYFTAGAYPVNGVGELRSPGLDRMSVNNPDSGYSYRKYKEAAYYES